MAWNPLDWLLSGKLNQAAPAPVSVGPELRAYNPSISERFSDSLFELLGGGSQSSLAHNNFARGVPNLLMATPLGIGLSAADLVRAHAANDPMGAAAAAIGMVPGAGRAAPEVRAGLSKADELLANIENILGPESNAVATYKANKAYQATKPSSADATEAALKAIEEILGPAPVHAPGPGMPYLMGGSANPANKTPVIPAGWEPMPQQTAMSADWLHPDDFKFENGQWLQKVGIPATKKAGQLPENPFIYQQNKYGNYDIIHKGTNELHDVTSSEEIAKQFVNDYGQKIAADPNFKGYLWQGTKATPPDWNTAVGGQKPIYDYEKDDNGLWHIFDAVSGKTVKIVDTHKQAKDWVANPILEAPTALKEQFIDLPGNKAPSIPAHPPWLDQNAVLPEGQREAARLAGGYTTPAWRGIRVEPGKDVGTVFQGDEMFSSANPRLADMYSSSLNKHPGDTPGQHAYLEGASGMPFWVNTKDYHVADAKGAMWSDFNWKAIQEAKAAGKKGVVIHNVWDEPHSTRNLGAPNIIYITFPEGLSTVKSKFAGQFNPSSKDISQSILAMLGGGTMALPFLQQEQKK